MAITKQKKVDIVAKLTEALAGAVSVVFVRFHKLSVADTTKMRKALRAEGIGFYVAKKTLIRRALADKGYGGEIPELPGEIAIAWGTEDATLPARAIYTHAKKLKDALAIVGGVFENAFASAEHMTAIATIPPVPVLRGMFVNVINSPIQGFVVALSKIAEAKA
jgi:large subunit ribosomal protein L10